MSLRVLTPAWLPNVPMLGVTEHWTAGGHKANATDLRSYHFLTEGDGNQRRGVDVSLNSGSLKDGYAAHTRGANTNRIGHSMCGMMGAVERPWNPGPAPLTQRQWDAHVLAAADLCEFYKIPVARDKLPFHAEVQSTLGIVQSGKWDVIRLPFDSSVIGAHAVGDKFRDEVLSALRGNGPSVVPDLVTEPMPGNVVGGVAEVTAASLNFRRGPGTNHESTGSLPVRTLIVVLAVEGDWINVRTPAGHVGWVHRGYVKMIDVAPIEAPTVPDPLHARFAALRAALDTIEQNLPANRAELERALSEIEGALGAL